MAEAAFTTAEQTDMLQVRFIIEDNLHPLHDEFIRRQPYGLVYNAVEYLKVLTEMLHAELKVLHCYDCKDELVGLMILFFKSSDGYTVVNSLPFFGSHGGPLLDHRLSFDSQQRIVENLLSFFDEFCKQTNITAFTMVTNPFEKGIGELLINSGYFSYQLKRVSQYNCLLESISSEDDIKTKLLDSFLDPRPRNIRKAIKSGVQVSASNEWIDFVFLYEASKGNMESKALAHKDLSFYESIYKTFNPDHYKLYVATLNGERIGALLNLYFNGFVEYFVPATLHEYRNNQPASLLIFEAMADAIRAGYKTWNWGGSGDGTGGVFDFKKKWGALSHDYYYLNKVFDPSIKEKTPDYISQHFKNFFVCPFSELKANA